MSEHTPAQREASPRHGAATPIRDDRLRALFESLRGNADGTIPLRALTEALERAGLGGDDPRLAASREVAAGIQQETGRSDPALDYEAFCRVVRPAMLLVEKTLQGRLVIPDFGALEAEVRNAFDTAAADTSGAVASYIPQLARVAADRFAAAVCTVDGQRLALGDAEEVFCVQSCCKPVNYCLALEENEEAVHARIGHEPSGRSFNELTLDEDGRPHNPMINAGAIVSSSLIRPTASTADRFEYVMDRWRSLCGGVKPGFSNPTYLSERRTADRNFALGYFIREHGGFPEGADLIETLEFYFQCCSIEVTARMLSVVAATLAHGGICPLTGERVLDPRTVRACLSLMGSCGMYDYSGAWAFRVGLPAKSGVSGAILVVVPGVMGACTWAPRLDRNGNSVRGIRFFEALVARLSFHGYDGLVGGADGKIDPRRRPNAMRVAGVVDLCWAASEGDLDGVRQLVAAGADLDAADYDGRTPLHLAASEGHLEIVRFVAARGARLDPLDRWGATPLDDARREGHAALAAFLEASATQAHSA